MVVEGMQFKGRVEVSFVAESAGREGGRGREE